MFIALCVVLAIVAIGYVLGVREQDVPPLPKENPELKHLEERRATLFENLKDLQFEYLQGKLSDEDYQSLKLGFQNDLAVVMASIDMQRKSGGESSPQAGSKSGAKSGANPDATAREASAGPRRCPSCDAENSATQRFCGSCGAQL